MPIVTVFRSRLRPEGLEEYAELSGRMNALARAMPGFIDATTFTADDGERVTIVTFADEESQRAWREHPEHREAQRAGRERLYAEYTLHVADVVHSSTFSVTPG